MIPVDVTSRVEKTKALVRMVSTEIREFCPVHILSAWARPTGLVPLLRGSSCQVIGQKTTGRGCPRPIRSQKEFVVSQGGQGGSGQTRPKGLMMSRCKRIPSPLMTLLISWCWLLRVVRPSVPAPVPWRYHLSSPVSVLNFWISPHTKSDIP